MAFDGVSFAYRGGRPVVRAVTARAAPGRVTMLIGASWAAARPHCSSW